MRLKQGDVALPAKTFQGGDNRFREPVLAPEGKVFVELDACFESDDDVETRDITEEAKC